MDISNKFTKRKLAALGCSAIAALAIASAGSVFMGAVNHQRLTSQMEELALTYVSPSDLSDNELEDKLLGVPTTSVTSVQLEGASEALLTVVTSSYDVYGGLDAIRVYASIPNKPEGEGFATQVELESAVILPASKSGSIAWMFDQERFDEITLDYLRKIGKDGLDSVEGVDGVESAHEVLFASDATIRHASLIDASTFTSTRASGLYLIEGEGKKVGIKAWFEWSGKVLEVRSLSIEKPEYNENQLGVPEPLWVDGDE